MEFLELNIHFFKVSFVFSVLNSALFCKLNWMKHNFANLHRFKSNHNSTQLSGPKLQGGNSNKQDQLHAIFQGHLRVPKPYCSPSRASQTHTIISLLLKISTKKLTVFMGDKRYQPISFPLLFGQQPKVEGRGPVSQLPLTRAFYVTWNQYYIGSATFVNLCGY